jgi:uncharacterized protein (DUF983 family)
MLKSMLKSIFTNKCPRCHKGQFWANGNPYYNLLLNKARIYERCGHCGLKYERETGYWYGAMYVGYGLSIAAFVTAWVATSVLFPEHWSAATQVLSIIGFSFALVPLNFYFSRLIWINLFTKYEGEKYQERITSEVPKIIN